MPHQPHRPRAATLAMLLACCLAWPCATHHAHAGTAWAADGTDNGITTYTREVPGQQLREFKGSMQIDAPMGQVAAALSDVGSMHEWFYLLREARYLDLPHDRDDDAHLYLSVNGIWPVAPRDVVARITVTQDPATLAITIKIKHQDHILPPQPGLVRIPAMASQWTLRPLAASKTHVEVEGHGDPGGWIPAFVANLAVTTLPRQSLAKMRSHVGKPQFKDPALFYARNPRLRELGARLVFPQP